MPIVKFLGKVIPNRGLSVTEIAPLRLLYPSGLEATVQSFHHDDVYFPSKGFAVDDLKSKVLIRLGAVEFAEAHQVRLIEGSTMVFTMSFS